MSVLRSANQTQGSPTKVLLLLPSPRLRLRGHDGDGFTDQRKDDRAGRLFCSVEWCGGSEGWTQLHTLSGSAGNAKEALEVKHVQGVVLASLEQRLKRCLVPEIAEGGPDFCRTKTQGLNLESLVLVPGSRCWNVMVDCLILCAGGNIFDALSIASRAALQNTSFVPSSSLDCWLSCC